MRGIDEQPKQSVNDCRIIIRFVQVKKAGNQLNFSHLKPFPENFQLTETFSHPEHPLNIRLVQNGII
ncbi:hypothetical protein DSECCO2_380780 [anaerobic digester metagenome]